VPGDQVVTTVDAPVAMPRFREMPGSASVAVASVLGRAPAPARVLGVFPTAVYVDAGDTVVAVVTQDAVRLPNAIVVSAGSAQRPFGHVGVRTAASVGQGYVSLGSLIVRGTRWWDPRVRLDDFDRARAAANLRAIEGLLAAAPRRPGIVVPRGLADAFRSRHLPAVLAHARGLVGLGPGLTPSGDDILSGALAAFRVLGTDGRFADALASAVTALAPGRTTALSATLLRLAADGQVSEEAARVLRAVPRADALEPAVRALLGLGHTSGADLAAGLLMGGMAAVGMGSEAATPMGSAIG
jgi:hypothetical protein